MVDILRHPLLRQSYEVSHAIEECGASEKLTAAVVKSSDLTQAIDKHLDEEKLADERLREMLRKLRDALDSEDNGPGWEYLVAEADALLGEKG